MTTSYMLAAVLAGCLLGALAGAVAAATLELLRGNGVVPQQAAAALEHLLALVPQERAA